MNLFRRSNSPENFEETPELEAQNEIPVVAAEFEVETENSPIAEESSVSVVETLENFVAAPSPLKPLVVGAFLGGELEIVEIVSRGKVNYYRANAGGWGENEWRWLAERAITDTDLEPYFAPDVPIFPSTSVEPFGENGREYMSWEWQNFSPFSEWRDKANDETLIRILNSYAEGLESLQNGGFKPQIEVETLFFDENSELKSLGFTDTSDELRALWEGPELERDSDGQRVFAEDIVSVAPHYALQNLERFLRQLARGHLAANATIRLDDEWAALPFSNEIKTFARALNDGKFANIGEARAWLEPFAAIEQTRSFVASDVGLQRDHNEDATLGLRWQKAAQNTEIELELLAVADGMGGHEAGEIASNKALETLQKSLLKREVDWQNNEIALGEASKIIEEVNNSVVEMNGEAPFAAMRNKPGTTLVWALKIGNRVLIGNVGDSRAYRWNAKNGLEKLTRDHSYVQDLLDSGRISEDQAWNHPEGNVITSHIGMARGLIQDVFLRLLQKGDTLFLVSDGVVDTLRDAEIAEIVAAHNSPKKLCQVLIDAANQAGGVDNISVAVLICE